MGKRKACGSQYHNGNQASGDDFHVRKYIQFSVAAKSYLIFVRMSFISFRQDGSTGQFDHALLQWRETPIA